MTSVVDQTSVGSSSFEIRQNVLCYLATKRPAAPGQAPSWPTDRAARHRGMRCEYQDAVWRIVE